MSARQTDSDHSPLFGGAIPGTSKLAGTLKDTLGAFRDGLGIPESQSSAICEGCGAPLNGPRHVIVRCEYCDRETRLP